MGRFLLCFHFGFDVLFVLCFVHVDRLLDFRHDFALQHGAVLDVAEFLRDVDVLGDLNRFLAHRHPLAFSILGLLDASGAFADRDFVVHRILHTELIPGDRRTDDAVLLGAQRGRKTRVFKHPLQERLECVRAHVFDDFAWDLECVAVGTHHGVVALDAYNLLVHVLRSRALERVFL